MMQLMRTTVTLDPETEHLVREAMRQRGQSFKEVLNRAIVQGLADLECELTQEPFVSSTFPMGLQAGHDPAYPGAVGDEEDVDAFLDLSRRLSDRAGSP